MERAALVHRLRHQAVWCARLGSPLYAEILERAAQDVDAGGPVADVLAGHGDDPARSVLALRLAGAVHRIVLRGDAPELARHYPSAGGEGRPEDAWPAFRAAVAEHADEIRARLDDTVQTNEVRRSGALLGGFLSVARETGLPLRLFELGASGGLNLRWDRYRYETPVGAWGDPRSRVRIGEFLTDGALPLEVRTEVVERRGVDANPLDPATPEGRLELTAYVWPDQTERLALLRAAFEIAEEVPARVERGDAADWIERALGLARGRATVVFHSIFVQYVERPARVRIRQTIEAAGRHATDSAPLAWLRMEPAGAVAEVRLTAWPGGEERLLGTSGFHGGDVHWFGDAAA